MWVEARHFPKQMCLWNPRRAWPPSSATGAPMGWWTLAGRSTVAVQWWRARSGSPLSGWETGSRKKIHGLFLILVEFLFLIPKLKLRWNNVFSIRIFKNNSNCFSVLIKHLIISFNFLSFWHVVSCCSFAFFSTIYLEYRYNKQWTINLREKFTNVSATRFPSMSSR